MKGSVGTPMGSIDGSRKAALKRNLPFLIRANDILTLKKRGEQDIWPETLEACVSATTKPSLLSAHEKGMISSCWIHFAKQGKLRGIRNNFHDKEGTEPPRLAVIHEPSVSPLTQSLKGGRQSPLQ